MSPNPKPGAVLVLVALCLVLGGCGGQPSQGGACPGSAETAPVSQLTAQDGPELRAMEDTQFWDIIDRSLEASDGSTARQAVELEGMLVDLPPEQVASFNAAFVSKNLALYSWELWGAAFVLNGGCSDDCFEYFRNWVVGQGSDYYEAVQRDPQALADGRLGSGDEIYEAEALAYTGADAYLRTSGGRDLYEDYPESPSTIAEGEPSGTPWDEEEVDGLYPGLTPLPLPSD